MPGPKLICIKSGCDVTDKRYGPVIQPLLGGGPENRTPSNGWKSSLSLAKKQQNPGLFKGARSRFLLNFCQKFYYELYTWKLNWSIHWIVLSQLHSKHGRCREVAVYWCSPLFLTREYAKRNERVMGMDGHIQSLTHSLTRLIHHSDVNFVT